MKKFFLISPLLLMFSGCGFDDDEIRYPVTKALFTYQKYNRQLVVGEGLEMQLGVVYSGVVENKSNKTVKYEIDPALVPAGMTELPSEYYTCASQTEIVIPKGSLKGYMAVTLDSLSFVSDVRALDGQLVLPVRLTAVEGIDKLADGKETSLISVSYRGKQFGYYTYDGKRTPQGGEAVAYRNNPAQTNSYRELITVGPDTFIVHPDQTGALDPNKGRISFIIKVPVHDGGTVTVSPNPNSAIEVLPDGASIYDEPTKTFVLRYKFTDEAVEYRVEDKLVFRNRIRDDQGDQRKLIEWRGF
jgi:hypothetical protein